MRDSVSPSTVPPWRAWFVQACWLGAGSFALTFLLLAHRPWPVGLDAFGATLGVCLVGAILTVVHLRHTPSKVTSWVTSERIIGLIVLVTVGGVQALIHALGSRVIVGSGFLLTAPLVTLALLISALLGPAISLYGLTITCFFLGFSGALDVQILTAAWFSGALAAHAINPLRQRSDLLRATSIQVAAMALMAIFATAGLATSIGPVLATAGWAALAAVSAIAAFWLMVAVMERAFGLVSDWSLLELCSPEHPLIRELCHRAPGTYAHSVMVGTLAENAARSIGANAVLARAMAHFHDVGKSVRPSYFIENQLGNNLHDDMSPTLSAQVIASHVRDGVALAQKHHVPQAIIDGIAQHHGTSLISYFYSRAVQQQGGPMDPEFERLFRYPGPKPQTREAAILHLCDQVEAVTRTLPRSNPAEFEIAVARIMENSRAEGQLDESDLTFADLQRIHESIVRSLGAILHERVSYPEDTLGHETPSSTSHHGFEPFPNQGIADRAPKNGPEAF